MKNENGNNSQENNDDKEDLKKELGLNDKRADELLRIVDTIMEQEVPEGEHGEHGRVSHILLNIAGRKDLNDVEKATCVFLFSSRIMRGKESGRRKRIPKPEICIPPHIAGMVGIPENLKMKEFIDIEGGGRGMIIAPEGVGPEETVFAVMHIIMTMLRQMPKSVAQEFCKNISLTFAKMAETGDIRL